MEAQSSPLTLAAELGDVELVVGLIAAGCDLNSHETDVGPAMEIKKGVYDKTPLMAALFYGHFELAKKLLEMGAELTFRPTSNSRSAKRVEIFRTALVDAILKDQFPLVENYITSEKDVNGIGPHRDVSQMVTPLIAAIGFDEYWHRHEICQKLINDYGADVNIRSDSLPPINAAISHETICWDCIKLMISKGAFVNSYLLEKAMERGPAVLEKLLHLIFCDLSTTCTADAGCLKKAAIPHSVARSVAKKVYSSASCFGYNENREDKSALEVLSVLTIDLTLPCMEIILPGVERTAINRLLNAGLKLTRRNENAVYPCCGEPYEILVSDLLLIIEVDVMACASRHNMPYDHSDGHLYESNATWLRKLLVAGADPNVSVPIYIGKGTPLLNSCGQGMLGVVRELVAYGGDVHRPAQGDFGRTTLQVAAENGHLETVRYLLKECYVSPNEPAAKHKGLTALQATAAGGYLSITYELLEAGADVNAARSPHEGAIALEAAAWRGRLDMAHVLINAGADISGSAFGREQYRRAVNFARNEGFPVRFV